jgi:hypothetical protein
MEIEYSDYFIFSLMILALLGLALSDCLLFLT